MIHNWKFFMKVSRLIDTKLFDDDYKARRKNFGNMRNYILKTNWLEFRLQKRIFSDNLENLVKVEVGKLKMDVKVHHSYWFKESHTFSVVPVFRMTMVYLLEESMDFYKQTHFSSFNIVFWCAYSFKKQGTWQITPVLGLLFCIRTVLDTKCILYVIRGSSEMSVEETIKRRRIKS